MALIVSLANLKGGTGKSASTVCLAGELVEEGASVLVIDTDPQGGATMGCGASPGDLERSLADCLEGTDPSEVIVETDWGADLLPSNLTLAVSSLRTVLGSGAGRSASYRALRDLIRRVAQNYEVTLVDTPPAASASLVGALAASDQVIVPVDCKPLGLRGVRIMLQAVRLVRSQVEGADPEVLGFLPTMHRQRTLLSGEILTTLQERAPDSMQVFPPVKHSVRFSELPRTGGPIRHYAPQFADPYTVVAQEVLKHV